jgi:hypothetical protein
MRGGGGKNEWSYTSAPSICLHGLNRDGFNLYSLLYFGQKLFIFMALWTRRQINKTLGGGMKDLRFIRGWPYQKARELLTYLTCRHPCAAYRAINTDVWTRQKLEFPRETEWQFKHGNIISLIIICSLLRMLYRDNSKETRHDTSRFVMTRHGTSRERTLVSDIPSHNTGYSYV